MNLVFFLPAFLCTFFSSCSHRTTLQETNANTTQCSPDSLIVFKRIRIAGAQQVDLEGNAVHNRSIHYRAYLFSNKKNIIIDSLVVGKKNVGGFTYVLIEKTPLYWDGPGEKILLVPKTGCVVYQIMATYSTKEELGEEENDIHIYYSQNGLQKITGTKKVELLPQMVTQ